MAEAAASRFVGPVRSRTLHLPFYRLQHDEFPVARHRLTFAEKPLELCVVIEMAVADDPELPSSLQRCL